MPSFAFRVIKILYRMILLSFCYDAICDWSSEDSVELLLILIDSLPSSVRNSCDLRCSLLCMDVIMTSSNWLFSKRFVLAAIVHSLVCFFCFFHSPSVWCKRNSPYMANNCILLTEFYILFPQVFSRLWENHVILQSCPWISRNYIVIVPFGSWNAY